SVLFIEELSKAFDESPHGISTSQVTQLNRVRALCVRFKHANKLLGQLAIEDADRIFFIELTRAVIEIWRADDGPFAVHHHEFAVNECRPIFGDLDAPSH